jgi:ribosome biogenesis GTPase / thiamine phosphate phosphatase
MLVLSDAGEEIVGTRGAGEATTGDWLALYDGADGTRASVLPRRTSVRRAQSSGRSAEQLLAANVDVVAVVVSLALEPDLGRLERLMTLAWDSGAQPLVVLAKADLANDAELVARDVASAAPGVDVVIVSAVTGEGLEALRARLVPGSTVVLLGQSGVGKSTLVNALAGAERVAVADVGVTGKGRHTTTSRELVPLDGGAVLLDTPGLRSVGLVDAESGLDLTFPEFEALSARCRFTDCAHEAEPGCAVLAAVEDGTVPARRLESWRKLGRELAWIARRTDSRLAAEERARWKAVHMEVRRSGRVRP